jgi:four helix bundle protein
MQRAATSIPSNIAEGYGRLGRKEYRQFLSVARGSNCELQTQFEIARSLGYGDEALLERAQSLSEEIGKMIYAICAKLAARQ